MTALKLALANLAMWARDNYFPPEYAHATWQRLASFFCVPGEVVRDSDMVIVDLRGFNDRRLNHDLLGVCALVDKAQPRLPNGRRLVLTAPRPHSTLSGAGQRSVA